MQAWFPRTYRPSDDPRCDPNRVVWVSSTSERVGSLSSMVSSVDTMGGTSPKTGSDAKPAVGASRDGAIRRDMSRRSAEKIYTASTATREITTVTRMYKPRIQVTSKYGSSRTEESERYALARINKERPPTRFRRTRDSSLGSSWSSKTCGGGRSFGGRRTASKLLKNRCTRMVRSLTLSDNSTSCKNLPPGEARKSTSRSLGTTLICELRLMDIAASRRRVSSRFQRIVPSRETISRPTALVKAGDRSKSARVTTY
mmetsp:Transcript_9102/g.18442  ORF Transcript_9102/g.18442 Transcript_9102/m.18442 type:complete len:257 (-) Transcript_9102:1324-2094(-)